MNDKFFKGYKVYLRSGPVNVHEYQTPRHDSYLITIDLGLCLAQKCH